LVETEPQRRYLEALVANAGLWDPGFGNPLQRFRRAGLPYDRAACSRTLELFSAR
jgi:hypothetical protein